MALPLSLTGKRWVVHHVPEAAAGPEALLRSLATARGLDVTGTSSLPLTIPAEQPPDLPAATERVRQAVARRETVGIFGDYDCDGVTAAAQMIRFFRRHGLSPLVHLPHRQHEGYGLKEASLRSLLSQGVTLLITVDTGITAHKELGIAREAGVDVIVVDHHHLPDPLPPALAILHPALAPAPGASPAAAGLVFGFLAALEGETWEGREEDLALAAIGTVADLVELRGVNRTLVREGLCALARLSAGPLPSLLLQAGLTHPPSSRDIAFRIAPRLNAAGRMDDPRVALSALLGNAQALQKLELFNRDRQEQTREILRELLLTMAASPAAFLTVSSPHYPAGILGLIAGKLTETLGRPSMAVQVQDDVCVASLRSIPGFHVTEALGNAADLLTTYGGHAQAAGCTFPASALPELQERLNALTASLLTPEELVPALHVDALLDPAAVSLPLCQALETLEPFGQGNPEPRFLLPAVRFSTLKRVGRDFTHLQGTIGPLKAVGFSLSHLFEKIPQTCDVACRVGIDMWNGNRRPQIFIEDVREAVPVSVIHST